MLAVTEDTQIFVGQQTTDMRKSIDGLNALIVDTFGASPQSGSQKKLIITQEQLQWLLAGLDFQLMKTVNDLDYSRYY